MKGVRQQLPQVVAPERGEHDVLHDRTGLADRIELAHQRVRGTDLIVPIRADEQQVLEIGLGQQVFEQIERRCVQPLQVVEEECQRMLRSCEDADEAAKHQLKSSLRFRWRELGDRWLFTNDVLQLGDEIDDQPPVWLQRFTKRVAPRVQVVFVLAEERPDEALECLRQRRIRDVALVLVELARCKQAARRDERLVELVDHRGLADARVSGHEHELWPPASDDAIERREQRVELVVTPVQLLGNHEAIRSVIRAGSKHLDGSLRFPLRQAAPEIAFNSRRSLIPLLGGLREELHRDRGDRGRHALESLAGCGRLPRDVTVHPFHRVGSRERQEAGQHLVERDSKRVQVAAGINGAVHSSCLLGRHVGERSRNELGRLWRLALAREARGDAKSGELNAASCGVDEHIGRLEILVNQPTSVELPDCAGQRRGDSEERSDLHRLPDEAIERLAACVVDHEHRLPALAQQFQWPQCPGTVQIALKFVFVRQPIGALGCRMCSTGSDRYEGVRLASEADAGPTARLRPPTMRAACLTRSGNANESAWRRPSQSPVYQTDVEETPRNIEADGPSEGLDCDAYQNVARVV